MWYSTDAELKALIEYGDSFDAEQEQTMQKHKNRFFEIDAIAEYLYYQSRKIKGFSFWDDDENEKENIMSIKKELSKLENNSILLDILSDIAEKDFRENNF